MSSTEIQDDVGAEEAVEVKALSPQQRAALTRAANASAKVIEIGDTDVAPAAGAVQVNAKNHDVELSGEKVRVTFFPQEGDDGDKSIFASLNGYAYNIPRDMPVVIPKELLEIFENGNATLLSTDARGEVKTRVVKRFQYSVHGAVAA